MEIEDWDNSEIEDGRGTEVDNYENEKDILSRDLRGVNDVFSTSKSGSELYFSPGSESGVEKDSERDSISDSELIIMIIIVAVAKTGFKDRFYILREIIMRKKVFNFINRVRRSNNL